MADKFWGIFIGAILAVLVVAVGLTGGIHAQTQEFKLLSVVDGGILYQKDVCSPNAFRLVFSFSQDLNLTPEEKLRLIQFSYDFKDFMASQAPELEKAEEVQLTVETVRLIGNRQIQIDYIANIFMPDQIEISFLEEDFNKIISKTQKHLMPLNDSQKIQTLLVEPTAIKPCLK